MLAIVSALITAAYSSDLDYSPTRFEAVDLRLDGQLDDDVWKEARPINSWYRQTPNEGSPPSEETTMWLIYDREAIYLAVHARESRPAAIMTRSLERDSYSLEQDGVGLIIDTYNDDRSASGFIITPAGIRTDLAIFGDGEGFRPWNTDWNAFWDAVATQDSSGWYAELRIPFSSLPFESKGGDAEMGVILWRYLARNSEFDVFPSIPNRWRFSYYSLARRWMSS